MANPPKSKKARRLALKKQRLRLMRYGKKLTSEEKKRARENALKFAQDLEAYTKSTAYKAELREAAKKKEYLDMYDVGRRRPGSFGP